MGRGSAQKGPLRSPKNVKLFTEHQVFTESELFSRYEIMQENYIKTIQIEAKTMVSMMDKAFLPSVLSYIKELAQTASSVKALVPQAPTAAQETLIDALSGLYASIYRQKEDLKNAIAKAAGMPDSMDKVRYCRSILAKMDEMRVDADEAERLVPDAFLSYPAYDKLLFSV